jgi:hypothetical protein
MNSLSLFLCDFHPHAPSEATAAEPGAWGLGLELTPFSTAVLSPSGLDKN